MVDKIVISQHEQTIDTRHEIHVLAETMVKVQKPKLAIRYP